jgi:E3 ubiquitin-protein ligase UHRF1
MVIPVDLSPALREECSVAGVHHPNRAGISGSTSRSLKDAEIGAFSIVLSGGYEDDIDNGYIM